MQTLRYMALPAPAFAQPRTSSIRSCRTSTMEPQAQEAHILGGVVVHGDVLELAPVKVLGERVAQHHQQDQGGEEAEAAPRQCRPDLLQGGGVELAELEVCSDEPGPHAQPLAHKGGCAARAAVRLRSNVTEVVHQVSVVYIL